MCFYVKRSYVNSLEIKFFNILIFYVQVKGTFNNGDWYLVTKYLQHNVIKYQKHKKTHKKKLRNLQMIHQFVSLQQKLLETFLPKNFTQMSYTCYVLHLDFLFHP